MPRPLTIRSVSRAQTRGVPAQTPSVFAGSDSVSRLLKGQFNLCWYSTTLIKLVLIPAAILQFRRWSEFRSMDQTELMKNMFVSRSVIHIQYVGDTPVKVSTCYMHASLILGCHGLNWQRARGWTPLSPKDTYTVYVYKFFSDISSCK